MGPCNDASTIIWAGSAIGKPTHQAPDTGFPARKRIFRASWEQERPRAPHPNTQALRCAVSCRPDRQSALGGGLARVCGGSPGEQGFPAWGERIWPDGPPGEAWGHVLGPPGPVRGGGPGRTGVGTAGPPCPQGPGTLQELPLLRAGRTETIRQGPQAWKPPAEPGPTPSLRPGLPPPSCPGEPTPGRLPLGRRLGPGLQDPPGSQRQPRGSSPGAPPFFQVPGALPCPLRLFLWALTP